MSYVEFFHFVFCHNLHPNLVLQHFEAWEGVCRFGDLELKRQLRHGNGWVDRLFLRNSYMESVLTTASFEYEYAKTIDTTT